MEKHEKKKKKYLQTGLINDEVFKAIFWLISSKTCFKNIYHMQERVCPT